MKPEEIRARLLEISNLLEGIQASAEGYTAEQIEQLNALNEEFEGLTTQLDAAEKVEAMKAKTAASTGRKAPAAAAPLRVTVGKDGKDRFGGFNSSGDFVMAVKRAAMGDIDKRFQNTAYERSGEDGGFLVPDEMSTDIQTKLNSQESLLARTSSTPVSGNSLSFPIDENQPWNQGASAAWLAEGAQLSATKNALGQASYKLNKLGVLVPASDELLEDAVAMEGYIRRVAPAAIMHKVNEAIISGNGAGKPQGILNSGFRVTTDQEDSQDADTIVAMNVINMYANMLPMSRANAIWLVAAGPAEAQLMGLKDGDGRFLYIAQGAMGSTLPYATLLGRPVVPMMSALSALGDEGDVIFADLSYYNTIVKSGGVQSQSSIHLYFDRAITAFRFIFRIDGSCPFKTPVTVQNGGAELSAIVTLEDRSG